MRGSLEIWLYQARVEEVLSTARGLSGGTTSPPEIMKRARSKEIIPKMWVLWARKIEVLS